MSEPIVRLRGVCKDYGREVRTRVLQNINLSIAEGEFASLIGPSGCGKSTLLNMIGLLDRPTQGSVEILGRATEDLDDDERTDLRARGVGFVFQFHHLLGALTAEENVMTPLAVRSGYTSRALRKRAREMLALVGLERRSGALPRELSGGEQQRVAIARAVVGSPPLLLADEPTGNLDTQTSNEVFELLRRLNRELNMAFLIVTHDHTVADRSDRVIQMVDGAIAADSLGGEP